jgi:radical SAM superfamily enzyme YgiQ (UPF0313 family)
MRIAIVDVRSTDGFVSKDTVVGGYGSRLRPFTRVTRVVGWFKQRLHDVPSVQMAYLASLCALAGHEVCWSEGDAVDADVALVLSSLVDYKSETAWAARQRARGTRVGFVGLAASKMSHLFEPSADFVIRGEPEAAVMRLANGARLAGMVDSEPLADLDVLPYPRWDLIGVNNEIGFTIPFAGRQSGRALSVLASRGCPEFCTYCPHRILAQHRERSVRNVADELQYLCSRYNQPYVIFRDPLFSENRARCLELCDEILSRGLRLRFECETRLDRLDDEMLGALRRAGLRAMSFGVETLAPETLKRSGRRAIPPQHQRHIVEQCRRLGIVTAGFYVFGFLQDTWESILATIDYSIDLGSTVAQFKILTPYPGTPMWKQIEPLVYEKDWERFDGYTPTFEHPNLTGPQLRYLLGAAYTRFYMRPSYLSGYLRLSGLAADWLRRLDTPVVEHQARKEEAFLAKVAAC